MVIDITTGEEYLGGSGKAARESAPLRGIIEREINALRTLADIMPRGGQLLLDSADRLEALFQSSEQNYRPAA